MKRSPIYVGAVTAFALAAAACGTGSTAAVLSNESDLDLCAWLPFARFLVRHGIRVLVYGYTGPSQSDPVAAARELRRLVLAFVRRGPLPPAK